MITHAIEKLSVLERTEEYVFHGSGYDIKEFEPRQAYNYINGEQIPDGIPAIFASPDARYAWFMAIVNDKNCPHDYHSNAGSRTGTLTFRATQETLDQLTPESSGYIYVFKKEGFVENDKNEYFSTEKQDYIEKIKVTFGDFKAEIEVIE